MRINNTLSKWAIAALVFNSAAAFAADLPPPYDIPHVYPFCDHSFYNNQDVIEYFFNEHKPSVVVEVGSWTGVSTIHMASCLGPEGKVYAVDHWLGSAEHQPGQVFWYPFVPYLYEQFLSNVIHANMTDKIVPVKMTSLEASKALADLKIDLVYIDGSHDYHSVYADLNAWFPLVKGHGILCGDDWGYPGVYIAVKQFAIEHQLTVSSNGFAFWWLTEN